MKHWQKKLLRFVYTATVILSSFVATWDVVNFMEVNQHHHTEPLSMARIELLFRVFWPLFAWIVLLILSSGLVEYLCTNHADKARNTEEDNQGSN